MTESKDIAREILSRHTLQVSGGVRTGLIAGIVAGIAGFAVLAFGSEPARAWQMLLVNFVLFTGIAVCGGIFSAILHVTNARWGQPVKRIAEGFTSFLPVSLLVLVVLFFGREHIWPWAKEGFHLRDHNKQAWLHPLFVFGRAAFYLLLLTFLTRRLFYWSVRPDLGAAREIDPRWGEGSREKFLANWGGVAAESEKSDSKRNVLASLSIVAYAIFFALLGIDLVMSLDPNWFSTMFGPQFFMTALYSFMAALIVTTTLVLRKMDLSPWITKTQYHDMGKLLYGSIMFWMYLHWGQYMVIWYGNLPEETVFAMQRLQTDPWRSVSAVVWFMLFPLPFLTLIPRDMKRTPKIIATVAGLILVGLWLERIIWIAPAVDAHAEHFPVGIFEILMTLGFVSAFALVYIRFLQTFPMLPFTDKLFLDGQKRAHH